MSEKKSRMKEFQKSAALVIVGIVALPILAFALLWFYSEVILGPDHKPSFLAKVTVDLVVDGEPVLISKIIECKTFAVPPGEFMERISNARKAPTRYFPTVRAFGARLETGAAIMMLTPYRCDHDVIEEGGLFTNQTVEITPNPPGALPMMAWTANADNPDMVEVYASHAYFDHSDARVKVNRIEVTRAPSGATPDPWGPYGWFVGSRTYYSGGEKLGAGVPYDSVSASIIKEESWAQYPDLVELLDNIEAITLLPRDTISKILNHYELGLSFTRKTIGYEGKFDWLPRADKVLSGKILQNFSYPFSVDSKVFVFEDTTLPYLSAYSSSIFKYEDIRSNKFLIRGKKFQDLNLRNVHFIYDPIQQEIIIIRSLGISTNTTRRPVPQQFRINSQKEKQS